MIIRWAYDRQININIWVYALMFIFSFQIFYGTKDLKVLFIITRLVFPIMSLSLASLWLVSAAVHKQELPYFRKLFLTFIYFILVNSFVTYFIFGQSILDGIMAEFKLLSVFYFFLILYVLIYTKATSGQIIDSIIFLGFFSFSIYYLINFFIDPRTLWTPDSELVYFDHNKGYRYKFRTIFGIIANFIMFRYYLNTGRKRYLLAVCFFLAYIMFFSKGRFELLCVLFTMLLAAVEGRSLLTKVGWAFLFALIILAAVAFLPHFESFIHTEDTSASVRVTSVQTVLKNFSTSPENIVFGFGYLNPLARNNMNAYFGESFFIADIGWLGLLHEFGLIGVAIFIWFYYILIKETKKVKANRRDAILHAGLQDFVTKSIITSIITPSIPYLWGIFSSILAILVYTNYFEKERVSDK